MKASQSATAVLACSIADLRVEDLPPPVVTTAKQCFLDTVGVAIAGASEPVSRLTWEVASEGRGAGRCTVLGAGSRATGTVAAWVNGIAAHALDYDDMHMDAMGGHPSAPLLPAVLAAAESRRASGGELLTAFVAGFEAQCRIGLAISPTHYGRGFHTTATVGTFGAAAGTARLFGLDAAAVEAALGIAALSASGLKSMFGSMGKPLQVGRAAASGFQAAQLAERGVTSASDALFCPRGFAAAQSDHFDQAVVRTPFGTPWHILRVLFKAHASCYGTHASVDALLQMREAIAVEDVEEIEVRVPAEQLTVCAIPRPETGLEGKFSIAFTSALALAHGRADEEQFTDDAVVDPLLVGLANRVRVVADDEQPPLGATVTITSCDGRRLSLGIDAGRSAWTSDPAEQDDRLRAKFCALVRPILGEARAERLIDLVAHLDELDDIHELTRELT
ncbi:MmgE/PrpD family protein [Rhodococcus opacus]|uniref:MmgE/PrpD family protein n=1 Tax=Rhodococcus opacus TaxID=37919 RepID=UPI00155ABDC7|nr:MmgE/PrpD family protein [Rhodococcus opacus]